MEIDNAFLSCIFPSFCNKTHAGVCSISLLGLLAKIKCSICSYQLNIWYVFHRKTHILNWFLDSPQEIRVYAGPGKDSPIIAVIMGWVYNPIEKRKKIGQKHVFTPPPFFPPTPVHPTLPLPEQGMPHCGIVVPCTHDWLQLSALFPLQVSSQSHALDVKQASKHEQAMLVQGRFLVNCVHWVKALAVGEMCWRVVFALLYTGNGEAKVFWFSFHSYWCIQARVKTSFHDFDVTCINCSFISLIMNDLATNKYNCKYNDSIKLDPGNLKSRAFE